MLELRPVVRERGLGALFIVDRLLDELTRPGEASGKQRLLTHRLQIIARHIRLGPLDCRLRLIDHRRLQQPLLVDGLDRRLGVGDIRLGLLQLGAVIVVVDLHQQVAGFDLLEVAYGDVADIAWNLGGERSQIGVQVGVVRGLQDGRSHPPIPFVGDEFDEARDQNQDEQSEGDANPSGGSRRRERMMRRISRGASGFGGGLLLFSGPVVHGPATPTFGARTAFS